jgi:hypothetical protein
MVLNDKEIRAGLKEFLNKRSPAPRTIIDELHVSNGNAIADVVGVYKYLHCFEIKGQNDGLHRVDRQADYYNKSFRKVTLVTTSNHLNKAKKIIPTFWGIVLVQSENGKPIFKYQRKAQINPVFNKMEALLALWKNELIEFAESYKEKGLKKSFNRMELAQFIAKSSRDDIVHRELGLLLTKRQKTLSLA